MAIDKKEMLLKALLGEQPSNHWVGPLFAGIGLGVVIGAGVALLISPQASEQLRNGLADGIDRLKARFDETVAGTNGHQKPTEQAGG